MISQYGLSGGVHGLPLVIEGDGPPRKFAGTTEMVLLPGTSRDVTKVIWKGAADKVPPTLRLQFLVGAEGIAVDRGEVQIQLD
jgi:hypothetical protein